MQELTRSKWLAFLVAAVVFTLAHISYWGGAQLIVVGFGAVILGLLYLWRRDLVCNMIAHFWWIWRDPGGWLIMDDGLVSLPSSYEEARGTRFSLSWRLTMFSLDQELCISDGQRAAMFRR